MLNLPKSIATDAKAPHNAGSLKIEVKDTGPGIPPELAQAIFEKGFSTKAPDRGFGLALVKKVLERRQGTLSFESSLQLGTTFRLLIPYEEVNYKYDKNPDR